MDRFFIGLHQPSDARHFRRCCIHVERLSTRRKPLGCEELLLDSRAFMMLRLHGRYPASTRAYVDKVHRIARLIEQLSAVTEDYMCEPFMLAKTGLTTAVHQVLTIKRYDAIRKKIDPSVYLMPVLQGYKPHEYVRHIRQYGDRLPLPKSKDDPGMWVGVGSVCKRNSSPDQIAAVLLAIRAERPDLRLHGFGVKLTALESALIRGLLWSADSMAWSYHARRNGRSANDWREAAAFAERIEQQRVVERPYQHSFLEAA
jgi:hypothetical protein